MGTRMKGIYKGLKYTISQIFVVKEQERELEIGYPTDVKHVAHIGYDGQSGSAPSWMSEFKTGPDFATTSIGNSLSPWSSQDFSESTRRHHSGSSGILINDIQSPEIGTAKKKSSQKHKKNKSSSSSSPKFGSWSSSSRSSRFSKLPRSKFTDDHSKAADIIRVL